MILITGASRGIGKFLFDYYSSSGEDVWGTYNNSSSMHSNVKMERVDVVNMSDVDKFVKSKIGISDKITLINCAGISHNGFAHKIDYDNWTEVINVNLIGTYNMIRAILPFMREQEFGRIINFSSVVAIKPTPGVSAYAASKAALWGLSKSVAIENASKNITINNINLGYSTLGMIESVPEDYKQQIISQIPMKHLCSEQDILHTVEFLRETKYITGSSIDLTGGLI
jgi:NAD(P)-dependent dehydrogenase (short-subunit alcohol dehydrogenase family)